MHGPQTGDHSCTLGVACMIQILGTAVGAGNGIRLQGGVLCGWNVSATADFTTLRAQRYSPLGTSSYDLGLETVGPPGVWRICWGEKPDVDTQFHLEVGLFTMCGVAVQPTFICTLGQSCVLTVKLCSLRLQRMASP